MNIYIPTYGRATKQTTWLSIPEIWKYKTHFVIRPQEKEMFKWHPRVLVCNKPGVAAARQMALDHAVRDQAGSMFMFDDDLKFARRDPGWTKESHKLHPMSTADMERALRMMSYELMNVACVAFGPRGGNNNVDSHPWEKNARVMRAFGLNVETMTSLNIRFDEFEFWEDFHVALSLLSKGQSNLVSSMYLNDAATNSPGGVSTYRTPERLLKCQAAFIKRWHPFAKPNNKPVRWAGYPEGTIMPDLRIAWKSAFMSSQL